MRKLLVLTIVAIVVSTLLAAPKYVLRFNHVLAATEPYHEAFLKWAKAVEERTNGDVKIEVFH
ncbi:MAG: C4-dicarboxylate ABC transporter, partial [Pseudothermotoga sp.]|nr:C4-dicarboxylate ABC transporter [Pseudothermotoga sp.]